MTRRSNLWNILLLALCCVAVIGDAGGGDWRELRDQINEELKRLGPYDAEILGLTRQLGESGDAEAIPFLRELAQMRVYSSRTYDVEVREDGEVVTIDIPTVRSVPGMAEAALAMLGDEDTLQGIIARSYDEQHHVRVDAVEKMCIIGGERVVVPLLHHLDDIGPMDVPIDVRITALKTLGRIVESPPWIYGDSERGLHEVLEAVRRWRDWQAEHYPDSISGNIVSVKDESGNYIPTYPNSNSAPHSEYSEFGAERAADEGVAQAPREERGARAGKESDGPWRWLYAALGAGAAVVVVVWLRARGR